MKIKACEKDKQNNLCQMQWNISIINDILAEAKIEREKVKIIFPINDAEEKIKILKKELEDYFNFFLEALINENLGENIWKKQEKY